jgi:hypothetical protein
MSLMRQQSRDLLRREPMPHRIPVAVAWQEIHTFVQRSPVLREHKAPGDGNASGAPAYWDRERAPFFGVFSSNRKFHQKTI